MQAVAPQLLDCMLEAMTAIDFAFSEMYSHGVFIAAEHSLPLANAGLAFLKLHQKCIRICAACDPPLNRFKQYPKQHMLFHCFAWMLQQTQQHGFALNPLVEACQMSEDLIGKVCRLSRRVDPRTVAQRTLESVLIAAAEGWQSPFRYDD
jgi:hypothetical protein